MSFEKQLVKLQDIDSRLIQLQNEAKKWAKPEELTAKKHHLSRLKTQILQVYGLKKDLELERASFQNLIQDAMREKKRVSKIMEETSDFRRMPSFEKQLADIEKRIEKNTFKKKEVQKKLDKVRTAEVNAQSKQAADEKEVFSLQKEQKDALEAIAKDVKALMRQKESLMTELSKEAKELYINTQKRFHGHGVEVLKETRPSFCRVQLQPSQLADLNESTQPILICPYCSRIIVKEDNFD